jgi:hypothetical protein
VTDTTRRWRVPGSGEAVSHLTRNDRFSAILVVIVTLTAISLGLVIRQRNVSQVWGYTSREAGIEAAYPAGWLSDEEGPYLVRLRDPKSRPFKTQITITIMPASSSSSVRNVLDALTIQRSVDLPAYRVLNITERSSGGLNFTEMDFAFVNADPNPFAQILPVVVLGTDLVIIDGDRAIVATFMDEQSTYPENLPVFQRFFASLRY